MALALRILCACALIFGTAGFYLPGVAPRDFNVGDKGTFKVNKLSSIKTQLPYEYYSLPYCKPDDIKSMAENLGEVLRGDRILNSNYQFQFRVDEQCKVLCKKAFSENDVKAFKSRISDGYRVNMIFDNLPVGMVKNMEENGQLTKVYERGFPVGFYDAQDEKSQANHWLHNHLRFTILYHKNPSTDVARVVGFEVKPFSVKHEIDPEAKDGISLTTCNPTKLVFVSPEQKAQEIVPNEEIVFTYDVSFQESSIRWASRWDTYLLMRNDQIHWFSIINSLMIVFFLSGMVAMIMLRTLHRDIARYNELESVEEAQEESGWKLVHGDVFRPPSGTCWLAVHVGSGIQILGMTLVTMIFALLGFLSPANRGGLMTAMLLLFVFMGFWAGFYAARLYKALKGDKWRQMTLRTALFFPGLCFTMFFVLNLLVWSEKSSGAVPFGTLVALCFLWFGISVPLVFTGSYFGIKRAPKDDPVRTNKIPRQIPEQPWYMAPLFSCLIGGLLPFGAVFIELFFVLTSIWLHQFYYIFGFLALVFVILILTCAEITIVLCYFQLCAEDYHWWWRSFLTAGSSAFYLFVYSGLYFYTKLDITKFVPMLMYFGYMSIISYGFFCLTGTVGFTACYWFVTKIYSAVKFD